MNDENNEMVKWLEPQYDEVRVLPDGSIAAKTRLLYTTAVFLGLDRWGYAKRFCYEQPKRANEVFAALRSEDDEPSGYIARR